MLMLLSITQGRLIKGGHCSSYLSVFRVDQVSSSRMVVIKRDGSREAILFDSITERINTMCEGLSSDIDPIEVALSVVGRMYPCITTVELDNLTAEAAAAMITRHPDYITVASR